MAEADVSQPPSRKQSDVQGAAESAKTGSAEQDESDEPTTSSVDEVAQPRARRESKALYWKGVPPVIPTRLENRRWHQLQLELARLNLSENAVFFDHHGRSHEPAPITVPEKAFDLVISRYVKYCLIAKKLDECYHFLVQPQKRVLLRACLGAVFSRILELKSELVQIDQREYQFLENILHSLDMTQADAELTIPLFIREERAQVLREREKILTMLYNKYDQIRRAETPSESERLLTREEAILLIQRQTRFFLGVIKSEMAHQVLRPRPQTWRQHTQRKVLARWKVYATRKEVSIQRRNLDILLGMLPPEDAARPSSYDLEVLSMTCQERAKKNEEEFEVDKVAVENEMFGEQGPYMAWSLHCNIRQWLLEVRDVLGTFSKFPEVEEGGSLMLFSDKDIRDVADDLSMQMVNGKFVYMKPEKKKKAKKDKKVPKKSPWGSNNSFEYVLDETDCMREMKAQTLEYRDYWYYKDDSKNIDQTHDRELLKEEIRPIVEQEIRGQVDELIRAELEDLTYAVDRIPRKNEKGDKKKKNKEKTAKGAKGDLTANRTIEELFEELVEQGIIRYSPKATLDDFIGDYSYSGAALDYAKKDPLPSLADVRRMVTEFAVLPLSSQTIHQQAPLTRKLLLAGVRGTGKKLLLRAICHETGATLFDLTPSNLEGKFDSPEGKKMLMHLILKVGKAMEPSVYWIADCEKMFLKKRDKMDTAKPAQWVNVLHKTLKKGIKNGDRMVLIGTSSQPSLTNKKINKFFDRIIIVPYPDYPSRYLAWKHFISNYLEAPLPPYFDLSTLTKVTSGFNIAAIKETCSEVLTEERKTRFIFYPLQVSDFVNVIWKFDPIYLEEQSQFLSWYSSTPLAKQRQQRVHRDDGTG